MQAEEPLLPREDVIAYAASKRKEDAPLTATDRHHHPHLLVRSSATASSDAKAGYHYTRISCCLPHLKIPDGTLLDDCGEAPAAARGGVWGAFDAARQWVDGVVGSAYEYANKRCGIETKIRQARSCARISIPVLTAATTASFVQEDSVCRADFSLVFGSRLGGSRGVTVLVQTSITDSYVFSSVQEHVCLFSIFRFHPATYFYYSSIFFDPPFLFFADFLPRSPRAARARAAPPARAPRAAPRAPREWR